MTLIELLNIYLNPNIINEATRYLSLYPSMGHTELAQEIPSFIDKLKKQEEVSESTFRAFSHELYKEDEFTQKILLNLLQDISYVNYYTYKDEITAGQDAIDSSIRQSNPLVPYQGESHSYSGLINIYKVLTEFMINPDFSSLYPGVPWFEHNELKRDIVFALNTLKLLGKLPSVDNYQGVDLTYPLYPLHLNIVKETKIPIIKGIKNSQKYYPFKVVEKFAKGDFGDNTFLATNGSTLLFVRGVEDYSPNAVLASNIAQLVSRQHFSSERLLDNHLVGSEYFACYELSVLDARIRFNRKKHIEVDMRIFPGTGIIDEVTNFIQERDSNADNYGLSSDDMENAYLSKIDFDRCDLQYDVSKEDYEQDTLSRPRGGIYHAADHIYVNYDAAVSIEQQGYIKEKLKARLKLSLMTKLIISNFADKAFTAENQVARKKAIEQCIKRRHTAFDLLLTYPYLTLFLADNPDILNDCYKEMVSHFHNDASMTRSIRKRAEHVYQSLQEISPEFKFLERPIPVDTSIESRHESLPESAISCGLSAESHLIEGFLEPVDPAHDDNLMDASREQDQQPIQHSIDFLNIEETTHIFSPRKSFLSRHGLKLVGLGLLIAAGLGIGAALTATGVFAPFGIGAMGYLFGLSVGLGAGLVMGSVTFGPKYIYDEYKYNVVHTQKKDMQPVPVHEKNEVRPSSEESAPLVYKKLFSTVSDNRLDENSPPPNPAASNGGVPIYNIKT